MANSLKWSLHMLIGCFGIGSILAVTPLASFAADSSGIIINQTNYNFGELSEMAPLSHDFTVRNNGKATLNIRDVRPS
jgi:hypothetical protein